MSTDDRLLKELAALAREERAAEKRHLDERWDALAAGDLEPDDAAELRATAGSSEDGAVAAWEAFQPFDDAFDQQLVSAARQQLDTMPRGKVLRGPWRRFPAALLAAAAILMLWLRIPGTQEPLPEYGLRLDGSVSALRSSSSGEAGEVPRFAPGNRLRLVLTPESPVTGPAVARAWLARDGELTTLAAPAVSEDGAVLLEATVLAADADGKGLRLPFGDSTLIVAVGRPGELPDGGELLSALDDAGSSRSDDWSAWAIAVRMEPED